MKRLRTRAIEHKRGFTWMLKFYRLEEGVAGCG